MIVTIVFSKNNQKAQIHRGFDDVIRISLRIMIICPHMPHIVLCFTDFEGHRRITLETRTGRDH